MSEKEIKKRREYLECGEIINTHGVRGAVKVDPWCDGPEDLAGLGRVFLPRDEAYEEKKVLSASVQKRFVLMKLEGVDSPEQAEAMRGTVLYAARGDMPLREGDYFIADLIGLPVIDADTGKEYGVISEVFNVGASDIYTVTTPDGERMIPAVDEFIDRIDLDAGVFVRPIGGMFD